MSGYGSTSFDPEPIDYGTMGWTDLDKAFGLNCTANMQTRGVTITSVATAIVQRADGQTIGPNDLTCSTVTVQTGGYILGFTLTGNGNAAQYDIGFPMLLSDDSKITRWITIRTVAMPG